MKCYLSFFLVLFVMPALADDCLPYKLNPKVFIETPIWTKEVVQPLKEMDFLHGNVVATMVDNYDIVADITNIEDGYCVALKSVEAVVGYSNFLVQIDIRHSPNTCAYDAVLGHEDQHIRAYLSVIDDYKKELQDSIYSAADSITPIFVRNEEDIDAAVSELNAELQAHPDLILIKQKIKAAEEIRNKKIDENNDNSALKKCFE